MIYAATLVVFWILACGLNDMLFKHFFGQDPQNMSTTAKICAYGPILNEFVAGVLIIIWLFHIAGNKIRNK